MAKIKKSKNTKRDEEFESVKVAIHIKRKVANHVEQFGGKIGKFYDIAAKEKLEREATKV